MKAFLSKVIALAALDSMCLFGFGCSEDSSNEKDPIQQIAQTDLESMVQNPPANYQEVLKQVIERHHDNYIRERAVFSLAEIALKNMDFSSAVEDLKKVATDEKVDEVRTAAYANIDRLLAFRPPSPRASLDLELLGTIAKGENIKVVARVGSSVEASQALVTIDMSATGIVPLSATHAKLSLAANQPQEVTFELNLQETGRIMLSFNLFLGFDRFETETLRRDILVNLFEQGGDFILFPY